MAISNEIEKLERRWQQTSGLVFAPLAEAYRKAGLHQRALEVLDQGLALHPDYGPALIVRGRCHLDSGSLPEAETAFDQALARDPMDPIAIRGIADVFSRTGRVPDAVERLRLLVDMDPRNAEARAALERLLQLVIPPAPAPEPATQFTPVPPAEPAPPVEAAPAVPDTTLASTPLEEILLVPVGPPPSEPAPLVIEPTALAPAEPAPLDLDIEPTSLAPVEPPAPSMETDDFHVVSFALEPLEVPVELREPPAPKPETPELDRLGPISWTPAPVLESPPSEPAEPTADRPDGAVTFTPAESAPSFESSPPVSASDEAQSIAEAVAPSVTESQEETPVAEAPVMGGFPPLEALESSPEMVESSPDEKTELPVEAAVESGFIADATPTPEPVVWMPPAPAEPVAEAQAEEYASPMPLPIEQEPAVLASPSVPEQAAEPVYDAEPVTSVEPVRAEILEPLIESEELPADEPPALIVTESMAELFLKQGHRELALAVYRQLAARGSVSERLQAEMARVEEELSSRATAAAEGKVYAARATGGKSVEEFLQAVLRAQPPAPASSVLPPAIEPAAGEPTRAASETLPLSAVFGDEPVVPPRPLPAPAQSEPSFDEFFGAAPSPEPTPAGGSERNPETEDLRQFNEWLKGLKR